jgi:hypothetical protein
MIVFAREVFVCKVATVPEVVEGNEPFNEMAKRMVVVKGGEAEIAKLDREHHNDEHIVDFRARLARGEHWMVCLDGDKIVTYTWLHTRDECEYPYLPGCKFKLAPPIGYGYDAWTPPDLRGGGLRRRAFLEELKILHDYGKAWEASYFVKHQLEGATRSLAKVGIHVIPLWHVKLKADKSLAVEKIAKDDDLTAPAF